MDIFDQKDSSQEYVKNHIDAEFQNQARINPEKSGDWTIQEEKAPHLE